MAKEQMYNDPAGGTASSVGKQFRTDYYHKMALVEAAKEQYFGQMASVRAMPKHFGKTIKQYHYLPLLDDRNTNDQGIDANGTSIANGNLYGSSKDVGTITSKIPTLSEEGGRKNRVGFKRIDIEGKIQKMGFFHEYTQESLDFDTDAQLYQHLSRELIMGANEITEDMLQYDLLNAAGTVRYAGAATSVATITGEVPASGAQNPVPISYVDYEDLMRLSIDLDNNRTPKGTQVITGTRMVDTKVIDSARFMYIGSELLPRLKKMTDTFGDKAFIPIQHYAASGQTVRGEVGAVDQFRIIVVPEMQHWAGVGATATTKGANYRSTNSKFDVFPMLVIGSESFTTIGFQTDGKTVKFKIINKKPGVETADRTDPYGEMGFSSIKWYYGFMALRPERIAVIKTIAEK